MTPEQKGPRIWLPPEGLRPQITPIVGNQAKRQINEIKANDRRLARRLTERIAGLLDDGPILNSWEIPDPPDIGPRYLVDLSDGYVAVYWVIRDQARPLPVIWVEQILPQETAEGLLAELAPSEDA